MKENVLCVFLVGIPLDAQLANDEIAELVPPREPNGQCLAQDARGLCET